MWPALTTRRACSRHAVELLRLLDGGLEPLVEVVPNERPDHVVLDAHSSFRPRAREPLEPPPVDPQAEHAGPHGTRVAGGLGAMFTFRPRLTRTGDRVVSVAGVTGIRVRASLFS